MIGAEANGNVKVILFLVAMDAEARPIADALGLAPNGMKLCEARMPHLYL
jgi:hypothetical protein